MLEFLKRQLAELAQRRAALIDEANAVVAKADAEKRGLSTDENTTFDEKLAAVKGVDDEIKRRPRRASSRSPNRRSGPHPRPRSSPTQGRPANGGPAARPSPANR
jgi:hypothetical protein